MRSTGNSRPEICAANVLMILRGEVPYERLKGLDRTLIDRPKNAASVPLSADALWALETYEPRVGVEDIDVAAAAARTGQFDLYANIDVEAMAHE
jgi:phage baseplate assembly protein W